MATATMTSKGQLTIPKDVRKALNLSTGDRVSFRVLDGGVVEMKTEKDDPMAMFGVLKPAVRGVTIEAMQKAIEEAGG